MPVPNSELDFSATLGGTAFAIRQFDRHHGEAIQAFGNSNDVRTTMDAHMIVAPS